MTMTILTNSSKQLQDSTDNTASAFDYEYDYYEYQQIQQIQLQKHRDTGTDHHLLNFELSPIQITTPTTLTVTAPRIENEPDDTLLFT